MNEEVQISLLEIADDELIIGWRDSEWTGIAPMLEEDVAFSSIAQNEIGHARAVYELLADDADVLAFDRKPEEYRCAPLVELHLLDWGRTIARRCLYEAADEIRITALLDDADARVAGLAAKINREEAYHRMHAEMWREGPPGTPPRPAGGGGARAAPPGGVPPPARQTPPPPPRAPPRGRGGAGGPGGRVRG